MDLHYGKRLLAEEVEKILKFQRELSARRDLRLFGVSIGWLFIGIVYCPKR